MTEDERKAFKEIATMAQWHSDGMGEKGIAEYPGVERDRPTMHMSVSFPDALKKGMRWRKTKPIRAGR